MLASNFSDAYGTRCRGYWATFQVTLTSRPKLGQIIYFVNASPPKPLDVAKSVFAGA